MNAMQAVAFREARELRTFLADENNFGNSSPHEKHRSAAAYLARETRTREPQVREAARLLMVELYRLAGVRACEKCGCTDGEACPQGCWWVSRPYVNVLGEIVGENLCSSCAPKPRPRRKRAR